MTYSCSTSRPAIDLVLEETAAIHGRYSERYYRTENPAMQQLIEGHVELLDHALLMLQEVREILQAEATWREWSEERLA